MRKVLYCLLVLSLIIKASSLDAQDIIYTKTGNINCKIKEVTAENIKYSRTGNVDLISIPTNKTIILFNSQGKYIVPGKMDFKTDEAKINITDFLTPRDTPLKFDIVYMLKGEKYSGTIEEENKTNVFIYGSNTAEKLNIKDVAAIIYSSGKHKIFGSLQKTADILYTKGVKASASSSSNKNVNNATSINKTSSEKQMQGTAGNQTDKSTSLIPTSSNAIASTESNSKTTNVSPNNKITSQGTPTATQAKFSELAPNTNFDLFKVKIEKKVYQLNDYLKIICNKNLEVTEVYKATNAAIGLFVDDKAIVQVSSLNSEQITSYLITAYLRRLRTFDYDKVEIEWTNITYVTNFRKGPDGQYTASITFQQLFRGFIDDKVVYEDLTEKKAEIKLKSTQKSIEGTDIEDWDVLLSDIGVRSTEPVKK